MTFIFVGKTKTIILDSFNDIFDLPAIMETAAAVTATVCAGLFMSRHMAIMARGRERDISPMPVKCQNETRADVKPVVSDVTGKNKDTSGDEVFAFVPDWESPFVKSLLAYIDGRFQNPPLPWPNRPLKLESAASSFSVRQSDSWGCLHICWSG